MSYSGKPRLRMLFMAQMTIAWYLCNKRDDYVCQPRVQVPYARVDACRYYLTLTA